jgi:hypothetical protein
MAKANLHHIHRLNQGINGVRPLVSLQIKQGDREATGGLAYALGCSHSTAFAQILAQVDFTACSICVPTGNGNAGSFIVSAEIDAATRLTFDKPNFDFWMVNFHLAIMASRRNGYHGGDKAGRMLEILAWGKL